MNNNYFFPKFDYSQEEINFIYLFFENGDMLEIKDNEVVDFKVNVYDKLLRSHKGFNPVVESGFLKLKISNKSVLTRLTYSLYNEKDFCEDRKSYIENRCVKESKITEIWLFNVNNCHKVLHCTLNAKIDGEFLIFEFLPQPQMGSSASQNHYINIKNLKKEDIRIVDLDFENCDGFEVYINEIEKIDLNFDNQLEWCGGDLCRKVIGGYIKIKLTKHPCRNTCLYYDKVYKIKDYEKRLCERKSGSMHDICNLYVSYQSYDYFVEQITIRDLTSEEEFERLDKLEEETGEYGLYRFESGYCRKAKDNSMIIAFGNNAQNTVDGICAKIN